MNSVEGAFRVRQARFDCRFGFTQRPLPGRPASRAAARPVARRLGKEGVPASPNVQRATLRSRVKTAPCARRRSGDFSIGAAWLASCMNSAYHAQQPDPKGERVPAIPADMAREEIVRLPVSNTTSQGALNRILDRVGKSRGHDPQKRLGQISRCRSGRLRLAGTICGGQPGCRQKAFLPGAGRAHTRNPTPKGTPNEWIGGVAAPAAMWPHTALQPDVRQANQVLSSN